MKPIVVGTDFSRTPGGRFISDGPDSGELFRDRILVPALNEAVKTGGKLIVKLDGPRGYLSSFLEEAFGGLIRYGFFTHSELKKHLDVQADNTFYAPYRILAQRSISAAKTQIARAS